MGGSQCHKLSMPSMDLSMLSPVCHDLSDVKHRNGEIEFRDTSKSSSVNIIIIIIHSPITHISMGAFIRLLRFRLLARGPKVGVWISPCEGTRSREILINWTSSTFWKVPGYRLCRWHLQPSMFRWVKAPCRCNCCPWDKRRKLPQLGLVSRFQMTDPKTKFHMRKILSERSHTKDTKGKFTHDNYWFLNERYKIPSECSQAKDPKRKIPNQCPQGKYPNERSQTRRVPQFKISSERFTANYPKRIQNAQCRAKFPIQRFHTAKNAGPNRRLSTERFQTNVSKRRIPNESSQAKDPTRKLANEVFRMKVLMQTIPSETSLKPCTKTKKLSCLSDAFGS